MKVNKGESKRCRDVEMIFKIKHEKQKKKKIKI